MKTKRVRSKRAAVLNNSRWAAYVTAGAATALAGATADAAIHYVSVNEVFNDSNPSATVGQFDVFSLAAGASFALDHNFRTSPTTGGFAGFAIGGTAAMVASFAGFGFAGAIASYRYVSKLASNIPIAARAFTTNYSSYLATMAVRGGFTNSLWLQAGTGFIGFKFDVGNGVQYGWARVRMDSGLPDRRHNFTLIDYAWADAGESLSTGEGAVPEPGSLGLLALGGLGLLAWRKRRASKLSAQA